MKMFFICGAFAILLSLNIIQCEGQECNRTPCQFIQLNKKEQECQVGDYSETREKFNECMKEVYDKTGFKGSDVGNLMSFIKVCDKDCDIDCGKKCKDAEDTEEKAICLKECGCTMDMTVVAGKCKTACEEEGNKCVDDAKGLVAWMVEQMG